MNNITLIVYYMAKEAVNPRMHHSSLKEYLEDVDMDCFRRTHSFSHTEHISKLYKLLK